MSTFTARIPSYTGTGENHISVDQEPLTSVSSGCRVGVLLAHMRQGVIRPCQRGTWVAGVGGEEGGRRSPVDSAKKVCALLLAALVLVSFWQQKSVVFWLSLSCSIRGLRLFCCLQGDVLGPGSVTGIIGICWG